jgi:acetylornithine deacetylase/succinyl-diaminopimelate desuccinylase-like protein
MRVEPERIEGEVAELLTELIRNVCVNDGTRGSGYESRSVRTLQDYLAEPGVVSGIVEGRDNLVYRLPGRDPQAPAIALMGHLDVVPVTPEGWSRDPFGGDVVDGVVWGRGAVDMLNMTAAMAIVFKRYLDGRLPPLPGDLLFLAVADEEAGGTWGVRHLLDTVPEEVACDFLLTEVPLPSIDTPNGPVYPVKVGEKGPYWRILRATGTPGHGSQPYRARNALLPLARAADRLAREPSPVVITDQWRALVEALSLEAALAKRLLDPEQIDEAIEDLATVSVGFARYAHACTHMTLSPNVLQAGGKANVIPAEGWAEIDIRTLPGQDAGTVDEHLRKVLGPDYEEIETEPVMDFPASASPAEGPLWNAIADALASLTGIRRTVPVFTPMTTDARFFRATGTVAYGVALFDDGMDVADFLSRFHGNDERVSVSSLGKTAALYRRTLERFGELTER